MTTAIIGLGGAGGNLAELFANAQGFITGAINFSRGDLQSLRQVNYKLHLPGSDGMGKRRNDAKPFVLKHYDMIMDFIKQNFANEFVDIIFFPFATGGGSGSGIAPQIIEMMAHVLPEKTIVAMPILPEKSESLFSQVNTLELFKELTQKVCILPVDNEQTHLKGVSSYKLKKETNQKVVQDIMKLISYTKKDSPIANFDNQDLVSALKTKGFATIGRTSVSILSAEENIAIGQNHFHSKIAQSWSNGVFSPIEMKQIVRAAFIFEGQEQLLNYIDIDKVFSGFANQTLDKFTGIYENSGGFVITLLTGLSPITTRLNEIEEIVNHQDKQLDGLYKPDIQPSPSNSEYTFIDKLSTKQEDKKEPSLMDILKRHM
jgi:cell division GTPase FtsZ